MQGRKRPRGRKGEEATGGKSRLGEREID